MLPSVGMPELVILLALVLLLFGAKRVPELAKGLGTGIREFKRGTRGDTRGELEAAAADEETTAGQGS